MTKVLDINGNAVDYEAAVQLMDDDLREELHAEGCYADEQTFFVGYAINHEKRFGEEWPPFFGGAW